MESDDPCGSSPGSETRAPAAGNATECAVMTYVPRVFVRPRSHHDRRRLPPQSQTRREHNMCGQWCSGRREKKKPDSHVLIRETDGNPSVIRTSHSRPPQKNPCLSHLTAVRCSLLIMPNERSDVLRRLDISLISQPDGPPSPASH